MPLKIHRILQTLAALTFLFCGLGVVNTMVSLRYEIKDDDCISVLDGRDLCQALRYNWLGLGIGVATIVTLSFVTIKPAKPNN